MKHHVDGALVPAEEATVRVDDRGFRYGDAAVRTVRAYGGELFRWTESRERLERTCETLGMAGAVPADLAERARETLAANDLADAAVRVSISRGVQSSGLSPRADAEPTVVIAVRDLPRGGLDGEPVWDGPAVVGTVRTRRVPDEAAPVAGTHNRLSGVLARRELARAENERYSPDETLVRDLDGYVAGGADSSVFFVAEGTLRTPGTPVWPDTGRDVVLDLAREEAFPVETGRYSLADVRGADEAFLASTTWEVRPVASVDGIEVGAGPVTRLLARLYDERVEAECYE